MHGGSCGIDHQRGGCLPRACSAAICCRSASTSPALVSAGASGMVLVVAVQGTARSCLLLNGATQCRARRSLSGRREYIRQLPLQKNVHQKSGAETLITCICQTTPTGIQDACCVRPLRCNPCALQARPTTVCGSSRIVSWRCSRRHSMITNLPQSFDHGVCPCVWPSSTGRCSISEQAKHSLEVTPHKPYSHVYICMLCRL